MSFCEQTSRRPDRQNLLGIACKFTADTDVARIALGAETRSGGRTYVVRDNGSGFDMAQVDKLLRPFQRLRASSELAGTGIGLATVARVIARHGGQVWAVGAIGQRATTSFALGNEAS